VWYKGNETCRIKHHNVYYIDRKTFLTRCVSIGDSTDKFLRFPLIWNVVVCWLLLTDIFGVAYLVPSVMASSPSIVPLLFVQLGPVGSPKTSVSNYKSVLCSITQEQRPELHCGGSPKFHK
jgi:hypothetical protein